MWLWPRFAFLSNGNPGRVPKPLRSGFARQSLAPPTRSWESLQGFPNPCALASPGRAWLRLRDHGNLSKGSQTLALWLRQAEPGSAYAIMGISPRVPKPLRSGFARRSPLWRSRDGLLNTYTAHLCVQIARSH